MKKEEILTYLSQPIETNNNNTISQIVSIPIVSRDDADYIIKTVDELGYQYIEISIETNLVKFINYKPLKLRRQSALT